MQRPTLPALIVASAIVALGGLAACSRGEAPVSAPTAAVSSSVDGPVGDAEMPTPGFLRPALPPGDGPPPLVHGPTAQVDSGAPGGAMPGAVGVVGRDGVPRGAPEGAGAVSTWPLYRDQQYGLSLPYPPFALPVEGDDGMEPAGPSPVAVVRFVDTRTDTPGLGLPIFALRMYADGGATSLDAWLTAAGITGDATGVTTELYASGALTGVRVMRPDFMLPAWSVYLWRAPHIIQLTPAGPEGETMLANLALELAAP